MVVLETLKQMARLWEPVYNGMYCKLFRSYFQAYGDTFTVIWYSDHEREIIIKSDFYKKFLFEIVDVRFL